MLLLLLLIGLVVFNKLMYKSALNPVFIQSVVWLVYYICLSLNIQVYDVYMSNIQPFIAIQAIGFSLGGFLCSLFSRTKTVMIRKQVSLKDLEVTCRNLEAIYPFVLVIILLAIAIILKQVGSLSLFSIMDFRDSLSEDDGKNVGAIGTLQLLVSVYVVVYVGSLSANKQKWYKGAILIFLFLYFTLLLGSKGQFVSFFCASIYLLVWQKKINKAYLGVSVVGFLGIIILLFFLRAGGDGSSMDGSSMSELFLIYTVTALPALFLIESPASKVFGYYTFRVFYNWLNKFGFDFQVAPVISEWVVTPLPTNVYSYLMPYYKDFGFTGVFVFPFILGIVHNLIYFKANKGNIFFLILNALLIYSIITQIWEENYFRQISNWVYISIIIIILTRLNISLKKAPAASAKALA